MTQPTDYRGPWGEALASALEAERDLRSANWSAFTGWALAALCLIVASPSLRGVDLLQAIAVAAFSGWCALGRLRRALGPSVADA